MAHEAEEYPAILPPYLRRAKSLEGLLPWLYLKGVSTGDFSKALQAILGPDALASRFPASLLAPGSSNTSCAAVWTSSFGSSMAIAPAVVIMPLTR